MQAATRVVSPEFAEVVLVHSPFKGLAKEFKSGQIINEHRHAYGQLLYATRGVMQIKTSDSLCIVPPLRALWIAAGTAHQVSMISDVSMRTLYVINSNQDIFKNDCVILSVTSLLRELIMNTMENPTCYSVGSKPDLIARLLIAELRLAKLFVTVFPLPQDRRLKTIAEILAHDPANDETLEALGARVGASVRTLSRLFLAETGVTFGSWRQQLRLSEAICRLSVGQSVSTVAKDLGYKSLSAFTAMFRRALGETPTSYSTHHSR